MQHKYDQNSIAQSLTSAFFFSYFDPHLSLELVLFG